MNADARQDFAYAFLSLLFEGAPFILLGTLVSGFIDIYLPSGKIERFLPKNRSLAVLVAGFLGAVFPVCECAVVPVIRRLLSKGLPMSCALTYMLAAPIVNPITALSTWKAFQGQSPWTMTCARIFLGYLAAVGVGLIVSRFSLKSILRKSIAEKLNAEPLVPAIKGHGYEIAKLPEDTRLIAAMRSAQKDFIDVAVYFTIGIVITALFNIGIAPGAAWLDGIATNPALAPAALMLLAMVLSLCSSSDAFIAATLDKFTWGAKLAFLVFGPMLDVKLIFLYQTVLRRKFILVMALSLFAFIWLITVIWQIWLGKVVLP
jgi:uncharacterized membrane protein YraQ (UPF0718 family)